MTKMRKINIMLTHLEISLTGLSIQLDKLFAPLLCFEPHPCEKVAGDLRFISVFFIMYHTFYYNLQLPTHDIV